MSDAKLVTIGLPLFLSLLIASGSAGILKGPVTYPENGHDYYLLEQSTWLEALREAQRLDGHLATFTSEQEAQWLYLYHTEGKRFRFRGEVWLGGKYESKKLPFPSDLPHGFALWLREWSGVKRYAANTDGLRVKRRLHEGKQRDGITWPVPEEPAPFKSTEYFPYRALSPPPGWGLQSAPFPTRTANFSRKKSHKLQKNKLNRRFPMMPFHLFEKPARY